MSVSVNEDFPEQVKPERAFVFSYVGVKEVDPPVVLADHRLVFSEDSAQTPQFHFMSPSSWPVWTFVPRPPGAHGTCLPLVISLLVPAL